MDIADARPETVLDASTEVDRLAAHVTHMLAMDLVPRELALALAACLRAYAKVQPGAFAAGAVAANRAGDPGYISAWVRQWAADKPPTDSEEVVHELPLWYLALILRSLRKLLRQDEGAWVCAPDDWACIKRTMSFAATAIAGASLEAKTTAGTRVRADQKKRRKSSGPTLTIVPIGGPSPLSA